MPPYEHVAYYVAVLGRHEGDAAVRQMVGRFGGDPVVTETPVGVPARVDRCLTFASGAEVLLQEDLVTAILLEVGPGRADLFPGIGPGTTRAQLNRVFGQPLEGHDNSHEVTYAVQDAVVQVFSSKRTREHRHGQIEMIRIAPAGSGASRHPRQARCPDCTALLVRDDAGGVDVEATIQAIRAGLESRRVTVGLHWVKLRDLMPLWASGLVERVEEPVDCTACRRVAVLTLPRHGDPEFRYCTQEEVQAHAWTPVPPVEQWGSPARIRQERERPVQVDSDNASWTLYRAGSRLFLSGRIAHHVSDTMALVALTDAEVQRYAQRGASYLTGLHADLERALPSGSGPMVGRDILDHGLGSTGTIEAWLAERNGEERPERW